MTISTQDSKVNYQGNGQTKVFQVPFPFLENNQIYVQKKDAKGNLINYTYATDYTVTGAGAENGGSVTLNVAPEQGSTISIYRDVPLTQEVDYRENEIFPAETHEEALDKLTMEVQQIQEQLDRSVKVDRFSDVDPDIIVKEIERVYDSTDNIDIVANNTNNVNKVAGNIANVNTVSGNIDSVVTTATNIKDVKTVAQNKASINVTAANINDIKTVSSIKDIVQTVANNNTNITKVGTNISAVNTAASNMAAIKAAPTAATNAAKSAANAANSATVSANSAIWAEGTDAQVAALGGVHSSKGWAQQSTSVNISLTNTPYTTNRILEIPQDIKLELNNGTLTLKAGSKVYVPNGPGVFDAVTVPSDVVFHTGTIGSATGTFMLFCNSSGGFGTRTGTTVCASGTTNPGSGYYLWYDTTNNKIKFSQNADGNFVSAGYSFPVGIYQRENGNAVSIDQVFNGFGYIGSTVFALPGVKVQTPNGKNKDGTYNNLVYTISVVRTLQIDSSWRTFDIILTQSYLNKWPNIINGSVGTRYNSENNYYEVYDAGQSKWVPLPKQLAIAKVKADTTSPYKITSFTPFTVDSVVNSNEFYQLKDKAVTTDTAQTISGLKTFNNVVTAEFESVNFIAKSPTIDIHVTPSANKYVGYDFRDKNNVRIGYIGICQGTDGTFRYEIQSTGNYAKKIFGITPPASSIGNEIVTAGWFNSKMQVVSALPANPNPNVFYFIPD